MPASDFDVKKLKKNKTRLLTTPEPVNLLPILFSVYSSFQLTISFGCCILQLKS